MLTCKKASQLISQSLDRPLPLTSRIQLRLHLVMCDACRRFKMQLKQLRFALRRAGEVMENDITINLPAQSKVRIADAIASKQI